MPDEAASMIVTEHPSARNDQNPSLRFGARMFDGDVILDDGAQEGFRVRKRIAILGSRGVGKSALAIMCTNKHFEANYLPTLEDVYMWRPTVDGVRYDVTIIDNEGQDGTTPFGPQCTIGVDGYLLVFSVADSASFDAVKVVNERLLRTLNVLKMTGTSEVPRILVGNFQDVGDNRAVSQHAAEKYAKYLDIPYMEASASTGHNVPKLFIALLHIIEQNLQNSYTPILREPSASPAHSNELLPGGSPAPPSAQSPNRPCSVQ